MKTLLLLALPIRLAFIAGMDPVSDIELYAPLLNGFEEVTTKVYTTQESFELFEPENSDQYDVLVFYDIELDEIPDSVKDNIAAAIRGGKPAYIFHDGLLTYNTWPEFARIAGMKYFMSEQQMDGVTYGVSKYKHEQDIPISVVDREHFITQGMEPRFTLHDEIYDNLWVSPDIHPLWTTSNPECEPSVLYTHQYGRGRIVGVVTGHGPEMFHDKNFQLAFRRGVLWLAGRDAPQSQADTSLEKQLITSGLVHSPLPIDSSRSFETAGLSKKILARFPLIDKRLKLTIPTATGERAKGPADDPDYATYGSRSIAIDAKTNWEKYNRLAFRIYPDCDGARVVNLNLGLGGVASHLVNLRNKQWNDCFLDIEGLDRTAIEKITFGASIKGRDRTTGEEMIYWIEGVELQQVEGLDPESGWIPAPEKIIYSTSGYALSSPKTAITTLDGDRFSLLDTTGTEVFTGPIQRQITTIGTFNVMDFTAFDRTGEFCLRVGSVTTPPFAIADDVWENSLWRVLNFIFCQRCGYPVPGVHGECHVDLMSEHNGQKISYAGGWHDAGDLSQQTLQTGDVTFALLEAHNALKNTNPLLAARLLEEAQWGLEFVLKNRYGDGYRASSVGLLIWLDGIFNTYDDISTVRVQNFAFDNFLYSAYEAYAAMTMDGDPAMQNYLTRIAKEDFDFAMKRHSEVGYGEFGSMYEHTYNTSESQYMATVSWAASMLYRLTGENSYAEIAAEYIKYTLDCQRIEPLGDGTRGFFYRDLSKRSIVHYIHQSREQVYMQALAALCETQPKHADHIRWANAISLYGNYLKGLMKYTAPYGMLPSGIYNVDEPQDNEGFYHLHLWPPANAEELYEEQIKGGVQLDDKHYVKRFPVWFGIFNGNTAVHLSMGKAAAICGKLLNDNELIDIGLEQMYWTVGKNPFGQSLIYGEGWNYPQMDSFSSGEMTGEMPVGIRSLDNTDEPYWPRVNNACYKEVWVTSAGKWLTLAAEVATAGTPATIFSHAKQGSSKILVLTERGGQHGPFTDAGLRWLNEHGPQLGVSFTEINNTDLIDDKYLAGFDAIIQLDYPPYGWTRKAEKAFTKYIDKGLGGWIGFHHASLLGEFDGFEMWPWFSDFLGGIRFDNYIAALADGTVQTEDGAHPVMEGVAPSFVIPDDEWYTFDRSPRLGGVHVLATVDEQSYSPASPIKMGDHPVVWVDPDKRARNVYFLMGHTARLWSNENFTRMISNAIGWTTST